MSAPQRHVSLSLRLFVPNATVLAVACVVLAFEPANGAILTLGGGLLVMVSINLVLIRRATTPLVRLSRLMGDVDLLNPNERIPVPRQRSEVAVLSETFNAMLQRLERQQQASLHRAMTEREDERRRISAELHDQIGQMLTAIALQLDRAAAVAGPEVRAEVVDARDGVLATVEDVRRLASGLRPQALTALGLVSALTDLSEQIASRTGMQVLRDLDRGLKALGDDTDLIVYRVAQEGLTNAVRHADATCVEVTLEDVGDAVLLTVADNGKGIPLQRAESGLRGLRERALSIGATLDVGPRSPRGTTLSLRIPTQPPARPADVRVATRRPAWRRGGAASKAGVRADATTE